VSDIAFYTAGQIARALSRPTRSVAKSLRSLPCISSVVRGGEARLYEVKDLPLEIQSALGRKASSGGYRGVHDLLKSDIKRDRWVPEKTFSMYPEKIQNRALALRDAICGANADLRANCSTVARHACRKLAGDSRIQDLGFESLRKIVTLAFKRDGGRGEMGRPELYLPAASAQQCSSLKTQAIKSPAPALDALAQVKEGHGVGPTVEELAHAADLDRAALIEHGISSKAAMRRVVDAAKTIDPSINRSALAKRIKRMAGPGKKQSRRGRPPMIELNDEELALARKIYVIKGSATIALRELATTSICRQEVADVILKRRSSKHTITPALRAQVAAVPQAVRDWHKSPTKVKREAFINPRTLTYIARDGQEKSILPGQFGERDDMSNNFIFWIDWPWGGDPCSDKYGVRIARGQNLLHIDVGSLRFLSMLMLVRLRDSYRADDIWQWVGQGYRDLGMPEIGERWERGIWQANRLHGVPVEAGHTSQEQRLGGIGALGRKIITSQSPTTKIIENRFRYFQRVCSDIPGQIGASRGEMEKVNKLWTACREGRRDPRKYFLSYEDSVAALETKLQWMNAEPVEGAIYNGIPNEIWLREGGDQRLTRLRDDQLYLFQRDRTVVTVTKGHVLVRVTAPDKRRQAWYFHNEDLWRHENKRVAIYYDKLAPQSGAFLVHAEGAKANQPIGPAEFVDGCPQFALGIDTAGTAGDRALSALDRRKAFGNAVRAEYRALGINHTIARGSYTSDGKARSTSVEKSEQTQPNNISSLGKERGKALIDRAYAGRNEEIDIEELDRLEAEAVARGDIFIES